MMSKSEYRELKYVVSFEKDEALNLMRFFPSLLIDDSVQEVSKQIITYTVSLDDFVEARLAYGAILALCDQYNAGLEANGMNRVRDKS